MRRYSLPITGVGCASPTYWHNFVDYVDRDWRSAEHLVSTLDDRLRIEYNARLNKRKTFVKFKTEEEMVRFLLRYS